MAVSTAMIVTTGSFCRQYVMGYPKETERSDELYFLSISARQRFVPDSLRKAGSSPGLLALE